MANLFQFNDYRGFLKARLDEMPKRGHGQLRKWAARLRMHTTQLSQIMGGNRDLSEEQAVDLSDLLGMSELECEFFLELVRLARANSPRLRSRIQAHLKRLRDRSKEVSEHIPAQGIALSPAEQAVFYSDWIYSAVRLLCSIDGVNSVDAIATYLGESNQRVRHALDFLTSVGLCEFSEGRYAMGPSRTHLNAESPLVRQLHANWRLRALAAVEKQDRQNLHYTSPMTVSREDAERIRMSLLNQIATIQKWVEPSKSESLICLNIDLFGV